MTTENQSVQPPGKAQSPAERMRAYRCRRRHGLRCVKVRVGRADLDGLVEKGHLSPDKRKDLHAIRALRPVWPGTERKRLRGRRSH
jgi:L-alanine-DL-glutamate epimerase-like enolase superfamily enzyme